MEFKKRFKHNISIHASANNGIIVWVGCCTLIYTDPNAMLADLRDYLTDPEKLEKQYYGLDGDCSTNEAPETACKAPRESRSY